MPRKRRNALEAKEEILDAAQHIFEKEGPEGVRIQALAKKVGVSHPTILYHFGSSENLIAELRERINTAIRDDFLKLIREDDSDETQLAVIDKALTGIADPTRGKLVAWLVASGLIDSREKEQNDLAVILERITSIVANGPERQQEIRNIVLLTMLSMVGESMVGKNLRERLGIRVKDAKPEHFRQWLLELVVAELARNAQT
jgi:AcrR family transcriptional regulator